MQCATGSVGHGLRVGGVRPARRAAAVAQAAARCASKQTVTSNASATQAGSASAVMAPLLITDLNLKLPVALAVSLQPACVSDTEVPGYASDLEGKGAAPGITSDTTSGSDSGSECIGTPSNRTKRQVTCALHRTGL